MTFYSLIWPRIILNFNPRHNTESKHMYIWYISTITTNPPDSTIWPMFNLWWPLEGLDIHRCGICKQFPIFSGICHQNWFTRWRSRAVSRFSFILLSSSTTWSSHLVFRCSVTSEGLSEDVWFIRMSNIDCVTKQITFSVVFWVPPTQMTTYDQKFGTMIERIWRILWYIN